MCTFNTFSAMPSLPQAAMMEQIGGIVAAFKRQRTEARSGEVDALRRQLAESDAATGGRFKELQRSNGAALAALQVLLSP